MTDHLALQARQDKLDAEEHQENADKEQGPVMDWFVGDEVAGYHNIDIDQNADKKRPEAQGAEESQGGTKESSEEEDVEQVYQAACEAPCPEF